MDHRLGAWDQFKPIAKKKAEPLFKPLVGKPSCPDHDHNIRQIAVMMVEGAAAARAKEATAPEAVAVGAPPTDVRLISLWYQNRYIQWAQQRPFPAALTFRGITYRLFRTKSNLFKYVGPLARVTTPAIDDMTLCTNREAPDNKPTALPEAVFSPPAASEIMVILKSGPTAVLHKMVRPLPREYVLESRVYQLHMSYDNGFWYDHATQFSHSDVEDVGQSCPNLPAAKGE